MNYANACGGVFHLISKVLYIASGRVDQRWMYKSRTEVTGDIFIYMSQLSSDVNDFNEIIKAPVTGDLTTFMVILGTHIRADVPIHLVESASAPLALCAGVVFPCATNEASHCCTGCSAGAEKKNRHPKERQKFSHPDLPKVDLHLSFLPFCLLPLTRFGVLFYHRLAQMSEPSRSFLT